MVCGVALSIAAHAAIALIVSRGPLPTETHRSVRLDVRLIEATVQAPTQERHTAARRSALAGSHPSARAAARPPAAAPANEAVAEAVAPSGAELAAPSAEPITATVFALPHIRFGGGAGSTSWMKMKTAQSPAPPVLPATEADPMAQAHAQREARRGLLVAALEQQVAALQAPVGSGTGACALAAPAQARLDCDDNALHAALAPHAAALSGLLQAYRSIDSRASGLSIGFSQGRYRVSFAIDPEPSPGTELAQGFEDRGRP